MIEDATTHQHEVALFHSRDAFEVRRHAGSLLFDLLGGLCPQRCLVDCLEEEDDSLVLALLRLVVVALCPDQAAHELADEKHLSLRVAAPQPPVQQQE